MRKMTSLLLALALVAASFTGCASAPAKEETAATEETTTEETTTEEAPAEDAEEAPVADGEGFKVGAIGPITGGAAVYGMAVKNGAQIAVDEINAAGGVNGTPIVYQYEDDEHDAEKSVNAYNTLKDWDMQILMGTVTSAPCMAVAAKTAEDGIFQLTPSGSAVECIVGDNAFRVCFSDPNQGIASAQYIGENAIATKVGVIYDSSDIYSSGIYEKFAGEAKNQGFEIVAAESFTADSKTDFTTQLQKVKDGGAELVFLPIYYSEASLILSQASTIGFAPMFFGCDGLDGILGVENFDTALAEGVMLLTPFAADATDELTVSFVTKYQDTYGEVPNQFAADAYDAMYIIKAALEEAGATADMSATDINEALKAAMLTISVDGLTGAGMTWTADGEVNKAPKAVKITDGVYTAM